MSKKKTIAVMMRDINSDFSEAMYDGFYFAAEETEINLVYLLGPQFPRNVENVIDSIDVDYNYQLDAVFDYVHVLKPDALILVCGSINKSMVLPDVNALIERYKGIPSLVLEDIPAHPSVAYQVADSYGAMCQCCEHLIAHHGYTNIVYISGSPDEYDFKVRLKAFKDTMQAHNLNILDDQIVICKQGDSIERKIASIFDGYMAVDAIVCCSDEYARIVYDVCEMRGLAVGKDVAVTGFDDIGLARALNPPLTSVTHNSFLFAYNALKRALVLADGGFVGGIKTPCYFKKRCSCGCKMNKTNVELKYRNLKNSDSYDVQTVLKNAICEIVDEMYSVFPNEKEKKHFNDIFDETFMYFYACVASERTDMGAVFDRMNRYVNAVSELRNISLRFLMDRTTELMEEMLSMISNDNQKSILTTIMVELNRRYTEAEIKRLHDKNNRRNNQLWFAPFFTRDLMKANISYTETMEHLMKRLRGIGIKSAHIFMFKRPVVCKKNQLPPPPSSLYHAGFYDDIQMRVYLLQNGITVDSDNGIKSILSNLEGHNYSAFVLYSGDRQYGLVLYEIDRTDVFFAMTCTLQIGSLLHFRDVLDAEEDAMLKVREQNDILSCLSDTDELTATLNRRGFMEKLLHLIYRNSGKNAFVIFADVLYLKEINDEYGHLSGDVAIRTCAEFLKKVLGRDAVLGRIGGDEFITVVITERKETVEEYINEIKKCSDDFNKKSNEEFFVEMAVGSYEFVCDKSMSVTEIVEKSHEIMKKVKEEVPPFHKKPAR